MGIKEESKDAVHVQCKGMCSPRDTETNWKMYGKCNCLFIKMHSEILVFHETG